MRSCTPLLAAVFFLGLGATGSARAQEMPGLRVWTDEEHWANRLADWRGARGGPWVCVEGRERWPFRTLMRLTEAGAPAKGAFQVAVEFEALDPGQSRSEQAAGIILGAGGDHVDPRLSAQVHQTPATDGGTLVLVTGDGRLVIKDFGTGGDRGQWTMRNTARLEGLATLAASEGLLEGSGPVRLEVVVQPEAQGVYLSARAVRPEAQGEAAVSATLSVEAGAVDGLLGLCSHGGPEGSRRGHLFRTWTTEGSGLTSRDEEAFGPVLCTQYTVHGGVLKLTAQLPPLPLADAPRWRLVDLERDQTLAWANLEDESFVARFRVEGWSGTETRRLAVQGMLDGELRTSPTVTVPATPRAERPLRVGALSCVKSYTGGLQWNEQGLWFPHADLVRNAAAHEPDLWFFAGDQIYEGDLTPAITAPFEDALLDYHMKWQRWCWSFGELTRTRPTVTIPDDHDVYHGNVWGNGGVAGVAPEGRELSAQDLGGYKLGPRFVRAVHATQVSHLPDPVDPEPLPGGIPVYHTALDYGGASFAILADRMWKPSPSVACPEGQIVNGWPRAEGFDPVLQGDPEGALLLGPRQLRFLESWGASWAEETSVKGILSQTIFANLATLPATANNDGVVPGLRYASPGEFIEGDERAADGDSNGWPRSARDRALRAARRSYSFHVAGDQHLASVVQYGVEAHRDGPFAFCTPAVANTFPRRWFPEVEGAERAAGSPRYLGNFTDGWGNRIRVHAVANPLRQGREPELLHDRMPGYGIVDLDPLTQQVSFTAWPRWAHPEDPEAAPYPGWPVRFHTLEQGPAPLAHSVEVELPGLERPLLQLVDQATGAPVYTVRCSVSPVRAWALAPGTFTVRLGTHSGDLSTVLSDWTVE
ncbi:MAG: hypothetical protein ISQ08_02310 [Planctomycetes bacterium]|nr:hypothetical protein [Planctomycetota bacterium]